MWLLRAAQRLPGQLCFVQGLDGGTFLILVSRKVAFGEGFPPLRKQKRDAQEYPKSLRVFPCSRTQPQTPRVQIPDISVLPFGFLSSAKACFRG